jgi:hypothetical protein
MFDPEPAGVFRVHGAKEASEWNEKGYGIFWTVNEFDGPRRNENLTRVRAWAVDIDDGSKEEQAARLRRSPLYPSLIIETKRGFQAYWRAKDGQARHWNAIVLERLVPFFGADKNARDLARILRAPGYYHCKNPAERFLVTVAHELNGSYHELEMAQLFPPVVAHPEAEWRLEVGAMHRVFPQGGSGGDTFWQRVYNLDCEEGLRRLSGHSAIGGEHYTFRRCSSGNLNILVGGKGTSCWIDKHKRIGSLSQGGPTLYRWLAWFRNSPAACVRVLKEIFPQLEAR